MAHRPDRVCIPLETEMQPLYRDPPGTARLLRQLKREQRRVRREQGAPPTHLERLLAVIGRRRA
jgi:hypothetical protein